MEDQANMQSENEDKPNIPSEANTAGGPRIAGDVSTGGGDFTGHDKTIQGDEVGGDKAGRDIYKINAERVEINHYSADYAAALHQIENLEAQVKALREQHSQGQEANRRLLLQIIEQYEKVVEKSTMPQDKEQLTRWQELGSRLWVLLVSYLSIKGVASILLDAQTQKTIWPVIKALPSEAQEAWQKLIEATPPSQPASPLSIATPEQQHTSLFIDPYKPEMVLIPGSKFLMGSDKRVDPYAIDDETPQHSVYLSSYRISRYPITKGQYKAFVDATGYCTPYHWKDKNIPFGKINHPVVYISWRDAQEYCDWLSKITHRTYRLPTEAEWEKAAGGINGSIYPWGNNKPSKFYKDFNKHLRDTTSVDGYPHYSTLYRVVIPGDCAEWTSSLYKPYPYKADDGREDPKAQGDRTLRGGLFGFFDVNARCAARSYFNQGIRDPNVGFRVVSSGPY